VGCDNQLVSMSFCSHPSRLKLLRCVLRDAADMVGLDEQDSDAVVLAVNEACMNIMQHAYAMRPDGQIDLAILQEPDALVVQLRDYADCVDIDKISSRDLDAVRPGGLGVYLIACLMDECGFLEPPEDGGNLFQMKKRIKE